MPTSGLIKVRAQSTCPRSHWSIIASSCMSQSYRWWNLRSDKVFSLCQEWKWDVFQFLSPLSCEMKGMSDVLGWICAKEFGRTNLTVGEWICKKEVLFRGMWMLLKLWIIFFRWIWVFGEAVWIMKMEWIQHLVDNGHLTCHQILLIDKCVALHVSVTFLIVGDEVSKQQINFKVALSSLQNVVGAIGRKKPGEKVFFNKKLWIPSTTINI